jgi:hypothetical protein
MNRIRRVLDFCGSDLASRASASPKSSRHQVAPTGAAGHPPLARIWRTALVLALLAGCSSPLIKPGPQTVDGLPLSTPLAWSDLGYRGQRLWTRDGASLNALRIYTDIQPGEHVFRARLRGERDEGARFRAGLSNIEIAELIVEGLRGSGLSNVAARDLRPATLNGRDGVHAELAFDSSAGLHYRGLILAEGEDGSLSFLMYTAPAEHYFDRDRAAVEAIFASLAGAEGL